jgi:beta-1,4-mannosyltransferase
MTQADARLTVMQLLGDPAAGRKSANPYAALLVGSLDPDRVRTRYFRWKGMLTDDFDVLHVHWPEYFTRHAKSPVRAVKSLLLLAFLLRIRLQRKAIVRTAHNLAPHENGTWIERKVLALLDRWTTLWFVLNDATPVPEDRKVLIPHGHYRDWYHAPESVTQVPGRMLTFGLIRAYKGVDDLLRAFRGCTDESLSLRICGRADSTATVDLLREVAAGDERIGLDLRFVPDDELAAEIAAAEIVVLPYREIHNSGAALLALSLNRPVLLRDSETTRMLSEEFGEAWVHRFSGELTAEVLEAGLTWLRGAERASQPDMSAREWDVLAEVLADAYGRAVRIARGRQSPVT